MADDKEEQFLVRSSVSLMSRYVVLVLNGTQSSILPVRAFEVTSIPPRGSHHGRMSQ